MLSALTVLYGRTNAQLKALARRHGRDKHIAISNRSRMLANQHRGILKICLKKGEAVEHVPWSIESTGQPVSALYKLHTSSIEYFASSGRPQCSRATGTET